MDKIPDKLKTADEYAEHMTALSEFVEVIAEEDIRNEFGVLLIPKGTPIKKSIADKLNGHQMEKTLDELVSVEHILDNQQILDDIIKLIENSEEFQLIQKHQQFENKLRHLASVNNIPRVLRQKLTVLKERLNPIYERSLFCAWFGSLIATKMELELTQVHTVFLAGLFHDLGMLHIPAEFSETTAFKKDQWRIMETHVFLSKEIVKAAHLYPNELLRAIQQHHERCDGTGYPKNLEGKKLSKLSQIISLCDTIYNIKRRELDNNNKTLLDLKAYLQVNTDTYFFETYKATYAIITQSELPLPQQLSKENFLSAKNKIIQRNENFQKIKQLSEKFAAFIRQEKLGKNGVALLAGIDNITRIVERSGLIGADTQAWLESIQIEDYTDNACEIAEIEALQTELLWLSKKSARLLPIFYHTELTPEIAANQDFINTSKAIDELLKASWNN
ncbi:HD-GYP domain-containing protein [Aliikangiella sp. IMCC44653]